jgi:hypothetical protein
MDGSAALVTRIGPRRLVSIVDRHSSSVLRSIGANGSDAGVVHDDIQPPFLGEDLSDGRADRDILGDVELDEFDVESFGIDEAAEFVAAGERSHRRVDAVAATRERDRGREADARAAAGDEHDPAHASARKVRSRPANFGPCSICSQ